MLLRLSIERTGFFRYHNQNQAREKPRRRSITTDCRNVPKELIGDTPVEARGSENCRHVVRHQRYVWRCKVYTTSPKPAVNIFSCESRKVLVFHMWVTAFLSKPGGVPLPGGHPHPPTVGSLRRRRKTLPAGSTKSNAQSFYLLSFFAITFPLIRAS
jgi:hypothetical protein